MRKVALLSIGKESRIYFFGTSFMPCSVDHCWFGVNCPCNVTKNQHYNHNLNCPLNRTWYGGVDKWRTIKIKKNKKNSFQWIFRRFIIWPLLSCLTSSSACVLVSCSVKIGAFISSMMPSWHAKAFSLALLQEAIVSDFIYDLDVVKQ